MIEAVIEFEDGNIITHNSNVREISKKFEKGFISCYFDSNGNIKIKRDEIPEDHKPFKSLETIQVLDSVRCFFKNDIRERVNKLGFLHKLGILLHGIQGTGKTSLMHFISNIMIEDQEAVCFLCNSRDNMVASISIAKEIRKIQSNPILFICDEFERFASSAESEMKNFLDGKDSIDNMLFLAATNYIDNVPDTIKNRPSRFRVVVEIKGITDKVEMKRILMNNSTKIDPNVFTESEIDEIVKNTDSITLDQLKSKVLEKVSNFKPVESKPRKIGFSKDKEDESVLTNEGIDDWNWLSLLTSPNIKFISDSNI